MGNATTGTSFEPVPAGEYLVRMNRIQEVDIKSGSGKMLKAGFEIINGELKGRLIFHNFIVEHTNPKSAEIGTEQLDKYLQAVGIEDGFEGIGFDRSSLENYTELPLKTLVKIQEGKGQYGPSNKIVKFSSRN